MKLRDTPPEFERIVADVYRRMPLNRKWQILGETFTAARSLHAAGLRLREPDATPERIRSHWLVTSFGYRSQADTDAENMNGSSQNLTVLLDVVRVLTELGIPHALGGSMASSIYGVARFTRDADLAVEAFPAKEEAFAAALGPHYYLSLPAVRQAVAQHSSFNVLHTQEGFKVDIFVRKDEPFERLALQRRVMLTLPDIPGQPLGILTPEDVILFKLIWFRLGNEVALQQWTDVLGVLRVQSGKLDNAYLDQWAAAVNVADLLAQALAEAGS
jgi:hypothetical protein